MGESPISYKSSPTLPSLSSLSYTEEFTSNLSPLLDNSTPTTNPTTQKRRQTLSQVANDDDLNQTSFPTKEEKKELKRRLSDPLRHTWDFRPPSRTRASSKPKQLLHEEDPVVAHAKLLQNLEDPSLPESENLELIIENDRVIAGTAEKLIERAISDEGVNENSFVEILILTHSYFMDAKTFFDTLLSKLSVDIHQQLEKQLQLQQQQQQLQLSSSPLSSSSELLEETSTSPSTSPSSPTAISSSSPSISRTRCRPLSQRPQSMANIPLYSFHRLRSDSASLSSSPIISTITSNSLSSLPSTPPTSSSKTTPSSSPPSTPSSAPAEVSKYQLRLINILKKWFKMNSWALQDSSLREYISSEIHAFKAMGATYTKRASLLESSFLISVQKFTKNEEVSLGVVGSGSKTRLQFCEIDPNELAIELTLQEFNMFKKISLKEFFHKAFTEPKDSPNLQAVISRFNEIGGWVAAEIVLTPNPKQRAVVLTRFIEVAQALRDLNNFNGLMQILGALEQTAISRLKQTWKRVPAKILAIYEELRPIVSPEGNQAQYRLILSNSDPPLLPYQGLLLKDLTFIEELPTKINRGVMSLVNYAKMRSLGQALLNVQKAQSSPYDLELSPVVREEIQTFLKDLPQLSEKEIYALSKQIEPGIKELSNVSSSSASSSYDGGQTKRSANAFWHHHRKSLAQALTSSWDDFDFSKTSSSSSSTSTVHQTSFVSSRKKPFASPMLKRVSFGAHKSSSSLEVEFNNNNNNVNNNSAPNTNVHDLKKKKSKKSQSTIFSVPPLSLDGFNDVTHSPRTSIPVTERKELKDKMNQLILSHNEMKDVVEDVKVRIHKLFKVVCALDTPSVADVEYDGVLAQKSELLQELKESKLRINSAIEKMMDSLERPEKEDN